MNNRFKSRTALITGGAEGLGKGIAERIASEGGRVILFDINEGQLQATIAEFKKKGFEVDGCSVDIGDEASIENALNSIGQQYGGVDIMVNSAGIVGPTSTKITNYCTEEYDKIYRINLRGSFLMCKYTIPLMEKNNYGRILLIASMAGKDGNPGMVGYSSMKAGVIGIVKSLGKEYAETGITVNGLAPAVIKTAMNENTAKEQLEYMINKIPMKRLGTIAEVASLAAWIVSEEASFNTGFVFDISGGRATY